MSIHEVEHWGRVVVVMVVFEFCDNSEVHKGWMGSGIGGGRENET